MAKWKRKALHSSCGERKGNYRICGKVRPDGGCDGPDLYGLAWCAGRRCRCGFAAGGLLVMIPVVHETAKRRPQALHSSCEAGAGITGIVEAAVL